MTILLEILICGLFLFCAAASGVIIYVFVESFFNDVAKPAYKILERELEECDKTEGDKNEIH